MNTTKGLRSEFFKILSDSACKFRTHILPILTMALIDPRLVP